MDHILEGGYFTEPRLWGLIGQFGADYAVETLKKNDNNVSLMAKKQLTFLLLLK